MTFLELQNAVMGRLNLTSSEARDRIKIEINTRIREMQTSVSLSATRRGTITFTTASGDSECTASGISKIETLYDQVFLDQVLGQVSVQQIRQWNANDQAVGPPTNYAILHHLQNSITILLYPQPTSTSPLLCDAVVQGVNLEDNDDEPVIPEDFQDAIVDGVMADELDKMEKTRPLADKYEAKFEKRLSDLRFFINKSGWLRRGQTDREGQSIGAGQVWPYANIAS